MTDSNSRWLRRLADFLIGYRLIVLLAVIVLTAAAWPIAARLRFDRSIESMYSPDDPHLKDYLESKELFGGDEFAFVAYTDPQLFAESGTELSVAGERRLTDLVQKLNRVPGVHSDSTQQLADALRFPYQRKRVKQLVTGVLVGDDNQSTAVVLRLKPELDSPVPRTRTIAEIRKIADAHDPPAHVVGEPVQVHDMFRYVEEDGRVLFNVSLALLAVVIFILFQSPRWVVLPLLVVVVTIRWTEAILVLSQMRLSMVSSMLNSLMTIIGVATVTHVTVHFRELRREMDRAEAMRRTFVELAPAIFWTCGTTAVGFSALLSSQIVPVQSFGIMMTIGTLIVMLAAAGVLPAGILTGQMNIDPNDAPAEKWLIAFLTHVTHWTEHHPRPLIAVASVLVTFAGFGFFRLEVETDFSKNFRKTSPIVTSLDFFESKLGGAGTWEVNFPAPRELSEDYLGQIRKLGQRLRDDLKSDARQSSDTGSDTQPDHPLAAGIVNTIPNQQPQTAGRLTKVVCLTDGLDLVPQKILFRSLSLETRLKMLSAFQNEFESSLYNADQGRMRIVLRAHERQPSEDKLRLIAAAQKIASDNLLPDSHVDAKATGLFVLLAFLIESLLRDQLVSFVLAAIGIGSMMTLAFRSVWIGLVSLVPNLFPIIMVVGMMGWIGLPINIATAMIASVSMGLTVDSSIHYISGYRRAQQRGLTPAEAVRDTHTGVGRALVFANLALIVGFSVLTLSHFIPLIYFGILVSVAMLGGLVGNLVLLPLLLQWLDRDRRSAENRR